MRKRNIEGYFTKFPSYKLIKQKIERRSEETFSTKTLRDPNTMCNSMNGLIFNKKIELFNKIILTFNR